MNGITRCVSFGILTMLAACTGSSPGIQAVQPKSAIAFLGANKVVRHSDVTLAAKTKAAFEQTLERGSGAFTAFFVRQDGRGWGFVTGRYTEQDAIRMAQIDCEIASKGSCILYATIVPQTEPKRPAIPSNHKALVTKAKRDTGRENYMAVANNPAGYTGIGVNHKSQAGAMSSAVNACIASTQNAMANEEPRFKAAYSAAGLLECKVFGVYR